MGWMARLRHRSAKLLSDRISSEWEPSMGEVTTIGFDYRWGAGDADRIRKFAAELIAVAPASTTAPR
jgi:hypothetical protein